LRTVDSPLSYARLDREAVRIVLALLDDTDVAGTRTERYPRGSHSERLVPRRFVA
jgi:hypothetical protein